MILGRAPVGVPGLDELAQVEQYRAEQLLGQAALGRVADRDRVLHDTAAVRELRPVRVDRVQPERRREQSSGIPWASIWFRPARMISSFELSPSSSSPTIASKASQASAFHARRRRPATACPPALFRELGDPGVIAAPGPRQRLRGAVEVAEPAQHAYEGDIGHHRQVGVGTRGGQPQRAAGQSPLLGVDQHEAEGDRGALREHRVPRGDHRTGRRRRTVQITSVLQEAAEQARGPGTTVASPETTTSRSTAAAPSRSPCRHMPIAVSSRSGHEDML